MAIIIGYSHVRRLATRFGIGRVPLVHIALRSHRVAKRHQQ